ncbi:aconitate hydratase AcnA [uncultured Cohaesibacter sp.]|uniref:aconitate hydratase AcnA n=1 Tax=uncultured Cohaesibacter sp. TaxID=1002546 RepID=UPI0029C8BD79|nr:aconitate hydratase AcnA [uncultured Cohaesibacter sp.]
MAVDMRRAEAALPGLDRKPLAIRLIVENLLRNEDGISVTADDIRRVAASTSSDVNEIAFRPTRVVMQDYAGTPALIDLAALRDKAVAVGLSPESINPQVPSDLVIDHSLMVHAARTPEAFKQNLTRELADNEERFAFLKWAEAAFSGLHVVPPGQGIIHQINIEHLAEVVSDRTIGGQRWMMPDTVIGTDSHTTMVNGLGVLGWGVGGIEAEAVMLGEPVSMLIPPVIGVRLTGDLPAGILATDLALHLTEIFRKRGVVGAILEFGGPGVKTLPVADRTTVANMSPEFGSMASLFPSDQLTMDYLSLTGRSPDRVADIAAYLKTNGFWADDDRATDYADVIDIDLSSIGRVIAGPKRPEERRDLSSLPATVPQPTQAGRTMIDGDIVIAAITSCTITSNPKSMIAAGLIARNARKLGLKIPDRIKTSLAPGSRVVRDYLEQAGLLEDLSGLGFEIVGFGCTTCVGNSGDLLDHIAEEIDEANLNVAAVLSGNRNFEGRIHGKVRLNYLMAPPMVVAYALAGTVCKDLTVEPIGMNEAGEPVMLADIWPDAREIDKLVANEVSSAQFLARYDKVFEGGEGWQALKAPTGSTFPWSPDSAYFQRPPFFDLPPLFTKGRALLENARPLLILGDHITTDHISPVGAIANDSPAADYLRDHGIVPRDFNAYGARRGDHNIMVRGTFANTRLTNTMVERAGGWTRIMPEGREASVFDASEAYASRKEPIVVVAGKNYGAGSARDWAAKGTRLLGCAAVIAKSFERIHRSNLVRLGVLPLQFVDEAEADNLAIAPEDRLSLDSDLTTLEPLRQIELKVTGPAGERTAKVIARVDTLDELRYLIAGGILPSVAEKLLSKPE